MKTKSSSDVAHVDTGKFQQQTMSARGKALVLKFDEKDKSERVKCFVECRNKT